MDFVSHFYRILRELISCKSFLSVRNKGCFVDACDPEKLPGSQNISSICQINNDVLIIRNQTDDWNKCLKSSDSREGNVCVDCMSSYTFIANQYNLLEKGSNGVCFEVVDQVILKF